MATDAGQRPSKTVKRGLRASCRALWRDHSLTITLASLGSILTAAAHLFEPGNVFDTVLGLGLGVLTVALFYFAANFLREVAKPED